MARSARSVLWLNSLRSNNPRSFFLIWIYFKQIMPTEIAKLVEITVSTVYGKHPMCHVGRRVQRHVKLGEHVRRCVGCFNLLKSEVTKYLDCYLDPGTTFL